MRPNLGFYVQTINDIVKTTEDIGEVMNPYYEEVRQAIDKNELQKFKQNLKKVLKNMN